MKTIKSLFKYNDPDCDFVEYPLNKKYYLWIERNVNFEDKTTVLIELHEYVDNNGNTDFIETLPLYYDLNTPLNKLTYKKIKQVSFYVLD